MRKFKVTGKVIKDSEHCTEVLATSSVENKEGESAEALKALWIRDMMLIFPQGPDYNVEYHCTVTPMVADFGSYPAARAAYQGPDPDWSAEVSRHRATEREILRGDDPLWYGPLKLAMILAAAALVIAALADAFTTG